MLIQPLARSRADQRRFVDRNRETATIIRAVKASEPLLLLGDRGSGRTTLLNHVAWLAERESEPRDTVLVRGAERLYLEPPADAFFEHTLRLGPFTDAEAAKLLRAHAPDLRATQVEQAIAAGHGNPRRLLRAAGDIQAGIPPDNAAADELA